MEKPPSPLELIATRGLQRRARTLFEHYPLTLTGDTGAIHHLRVSGRRLRVALPLLARKPQGGRVRRAERLLRELVRIAGACRDLDVCLALLDELPASPEMSAFRRRMRASRSRARRQMTESLLDTDLARLRQDIREIVRRGSEEPSTVQFRIRRNRDLLAEEILGKLHGLGRKYDPAALHLLRRSVRRLRYSGEVAVELSNVPAEAHKLLKEMQDLLGRIHDTHMMADRCARQRRQAPAVAGAQAAPTASSLAARRLETTFHQRSRALHRAFLDSDPAGTVGKILAHLGAAREGRISRISL